MDVFIKICGIARQQDLLEVSALKPDALGFVLWPKSPRCMDPDNLVKWLPMVSTKALKVGVFVDPDPQEAIGIARKAGLDVIQIHGNQSANPYEVAGIKVWRAVHADRISPTEVDSGYVDAYVADTYSKDQPGGTGKVGNWEAVRSLVQVSSKPVLLAGGLHTGNIREALRAVHPWGVDVSSGVEVEPGKKDINKVRDFIQQCRTA